MSEKNGSCLIKSNQNLRKKYKKNKTEKSWQCINTTYYYFNIIEINRNIQ